MRLNFDMDMRTYFQKLVEDGGGEFVDLKDNAVYFRSAPGESIISLYPAFLKTPEDVALALKSISERKKEGMWEFAPAVKEQNA